MPYIYSGVCLAAMFGSIIYEHRRMKREESKLREAMKDLAAKAKAEAAKSAHDFHSGLIGA
ncbi:MAG: hypothetical protein LBV79_11720 [Candidatus Adiutrix sp.]|jgi:hypothetical protein|nr:hypothetical protein [Candidatus Adiutrix sp.]